ncbi:MAG: SpoIIE family protein phosphatase [Treponema sp.]|nr:SpoIIE family protein phosphatase [Treponema sp.]
MNDNIFIDESFFLGTKKENENDYITALRGSFSEKQIGAIANYVEPVSSLSSIDTVVELFKNNSELNAVPVEEYDRVVGVIDRKTAAEATNTAWKRFTAKNAIDYTTRVSTILYAQDFIETSLQKVSEINRETNIIYFPVFNNRSFYGIVSLDSFLTRIAKIREQDLEKASIIQQGFLPNEAVVRQLPYKFYAWNKMANALGGDIYQIYKLSDTESLVCCFDISGKNVAASLLTIAVNSFFKTLEIYPPAENNHLKIIANLDTYLQKVIPLGNFITAAICYIDTAKGTCSIFNCGHTVIYCLYKEIQTAPNGKIAVIEPGLPPLGLGDIQSAFAAHEKKPYVFIPLHKNMHINLYTDGFSDMQNDDGIRFNDAHVKEFFIKLYNEKDDDVCSTIKETVTSWIQNAMIPDDITVIDIRFP